MFASLISPAVAEKIIAEHVTAHRSEWVPLTKAWGRALRSPIVADRDFPPYHRATMDGYISKNPLLVGQCHKVEGTSYAGDQFSILATDQLCEIATGSSVEFEKSHLVPFEWTKRTSSGEVEIIQSSVAGQFIHARGADSAMGDEILSSGQIIGAGEIAIAASVGATKLCVTAKPRIGLLTTGNEIVSYESTPQDWQIRGSHAPMLLSILQADGYDQCMVKHVGDDEDSTRTALQEMAENVDVIIITGGICAGAKDLIHKVVSAIYGPPLFHGIAQKPGKPMAFWGGSPTIFALPGNPLSVLTTFSRYVIPALCRMEMRGFSPQFFAMPSDVKALDRLTLFLPYHSVSGRYSMFSNSGNMMSIRGMNGVLQIPSQHETIASFSACAYYPSNFPRP